MKPSSYALLLEPPPCFVHALFYRAAQPSCRIRLIACVGGGDQVDFKNKSNNKTQTENSCPIVCAGRHLGECSDQRTSSISFYQQPCQPIRFEMRYDCTAIGSQGNKDGTSFCPQHQYLGTRLKPDILAKSAPNHYITGEVKACLWKSR